MSFSTLVPDITTTEALLLAYRRMYMSLLEGLKVANEIDSLPPTLTLPRTFPVACCAEEDEVATVVVVEVFVEEVDDEDELVVRVVVLDWVEEVVPLELVLAVCESAA
jgi:hypothetical protein